MTVSVPQGMLTAMDRTLLQVSNKEELPVVVGSLHACVLYDGETALKCEEPWYGMGVVAGWDGLRFLVAGKRFAARVPWLSAVRIWRPDMVPDEQVIKGVIAEHQTGSVQQVHP